MNTPPVFSNLRLCIYRHLHFPATKDCADRLPDMDELVKIPLVAGPLMCDVAHPWKARDLKAKRDATVNQPDIRVLPTQGWTGTHDADSSGAASI
jgi:hypothetical protein